jgi:hypothetical protein
MADVRLNISFSVVISLPIVHKQKMNVTVVTVTLKHRLAVGKMIAMVTTNGFVVMPHQYL